MQVTEVECRSLMTGQILWLGWVLKADHPSSHGRRSDDSRTGCTGVQRGRFRILGWSLPHTAELATAIQQIKRLTDRPFAVNLFAASPERALTENQIEAAVLATRSYRQELGIPDRVLKPPFSQSFEEQFSVVMRRQPAVFSFTFAVPERKFLDECRKRNTLTFGTATTPAEGLELQENGVDAVVGQGAEAGAQRGTFSPEREDPFIGLAALIPALVSRLRIPVIVAGGIMNGQGIVAALALGTMCEGG